MTVELRQQKGTVLLLVVFVVALFSTAVMGILQINTEEVQLMQNHVYMAEAQAIAEAGLNDALAQLHHDSTWIDGFTDKAFASGTYRVSVDGRTVTSVGTTRQGFVSRVEADLSLSQGNNGTYNIVIIAMRVNE